MDVADNQPQGGSDAAPATLESQGPGGNEGCRLFGRLWAKLSTILGTPAAAALMRRAVSAAATGYPELRGIAITRERLTYTYRLPDSLCTDELENPVLAFRTLMGEVLRLTGELTGGVMVRGLLKSEELSPWLPDMQEVDKWLTSGE